MAAISGDLTERRGEEKREVLSLGHRGDPVVVEKS